MWDTAGQERFRSISQAYFRNAHGCIAVYDVTNRKSFDALADQLSNFINHAPKDTAHNIVIVGNKLDLADDERQVNFCDAQNLARELKLAGALEASAKDGSDTIDDAFFIATVNAIDIKEAEALR